jgi:arylsulfatase
LALIARALLPLLTFAAAAEAQDKPNILVIWGDDIGVTNISLTASE